MARFDILLPAALAAAALSGLAASPSFAADKPTAKAAAAPITAQQAIDLQDKFLHALYGTDPILSRPFCPRMLPSPTRTAWRWTRRAR